MTMMPFAIQIMKRCEALASISQSPGIIDRRYLTPQHKQANLVVADWMREAGMTCWEDQAGNQWGCRKSSKPNAQTLLIGSHLDTVPNSGKYDGILGVLLPISLMQHYQEAGRELPFHVEIVAFADEEGTRFGTTLLGSRAVANTWQDKWAGLTDIDNIKLADAMRTFGLNVNHVHKASRADADLLGFLEVHIEQGPVLEARDIPVGIVDGIAGARRFSIEITGQAGHAGTVPMQMRQDALAGAADIILAAENMANKHHIVATVGRIESFPNAVNVISGASNISLDVRSLDNEKRDAAINELFQLINDIGYSRSLKINIKQTHEAQAVQCDDNIIRQLKTSCKRAGLADFCLPSGAGHDAMAIAELCPTGMLFVRCEKGISHHPAEAVKVQDVHAALVVVDEFVKQNALMVAQ